MYSQLEAYLTSLAQLLQTSVGARWLVGAAGVVLALWGAKLYHLLRHLLAFCTGGLLGVLVLQWVAQTAPQLGQPWVIAAGAAGTGLLGVVVGHLVHRLMLVVVGGLVGLVLGAGLGQFTGVGHPALWGFAAAGGGALCFPWLMNPALRVLMPLVGAVLVATALAQPLSVGVVVGLWIVGLLVSWALGRTGAPIVDSSNAS